MTKFVEVYDGAYDMLYQCEVSDETAAKIAKVHKVSDTKIVGIPLLPANRSEWTDELLGLQSP